MKSMWLPLVAIFYMTNLNRAAGAMAPLPPPGSATAPPTSPKLVDPPPALSQCTMLKHPAHSFSLLTLPVAVRGFSPGGGAPTPKIAIIC